MRRWQVIGLAIVCASTGVAMSFALASFVSWQLAVSAQRRQVEQDAEAALEHAAAVYTEAASVLREIASEKNVPCSPEQILRMLQAMEESSVVVNIGYGAGEVVECNSWGRLTYRLLKAPAAIIQPDGIGVAANWRPKTFGTDRSMLILRLNDYSALIDQLRFYSDWEGSGESHLDSVRLADGTKLLPSYVQSLGPRAVDETDIRSSESGSGLSVTVSQPSITFAGYLRSERALALPFLISLVLFFGLLALLWLRRRLSLAGELRVAVHRRQIAAHYQPIMELTTGRCVGAEALARWRREDGLDVPPDVFIPLVERDGLIANVTDQIIAAVARELGPWLRTHSHVHIGINLSASEVSAGRYLRTLDDALRASGIGSHQVWLEATESGIIDLNVARATFVELRRRGHRMALDDFGTGYAGLSYLQQLQVDVLKVDRCFIEAIGTDAATRDVTELIISMAHQLELAVVAEGVETQAQADYLRDKGVRYAQGWLYAPALPANDFLAFWASHCEGGSTPEAETSGRRGSARP